MRSYDRYPDAPSHRDTTTVRAIPVGSGCVLTVATLTSRSCPPSCLCQGPSPCACRLYHPPCSLCLSPVPPPSAAHRPSGPDPRPWQRGVVRGFYCARPRCALRRAALARGRVHVHRLCGLLASRGSHFAMKHLTSERLSRRSQGEAAVCSAAKERATRPWGASQVALRRAPRWPSVAASPSPAGPSAP